MSEPPTSDIPWQTDPRYGSVAVCYPTTDRYNGSRITGCRIWITNCIVIWVNCMKSSEKRCISESLLELHIISGA
jgi:hypothetical protein